MSKHPGKSSSNKLINEDEQEVALGKQNVRALCAKVKLDVKFFSRPCSKIHAILEVILFIDYQPRRGVGDFGFWSHLRMFWAKRHHI